MLVIFPSFAVIWSTAPEAYYYWGVMGRDSWFQQCAGKHAFFPFNIRYYWGDAPIQIIGDCPPPPPPPASGTYDYVHIYGTDKLLFLMFQLLSDERVENEKRQHAMDKRIQELRKKYGLLPGEGVVYTMLSIRWCETFPDVCHIKF